MFLFKVLGKSGAIQILLALSEEEKNYYQLTKIVGHSTQTLNRIRELQKLGLIKKGAKGKRGAIFYSLTQKGYEICSFIKKYEK